MALVQQSSQTDIATLWEEALTSYSEIAKVDIRKVPTPQRSIASIMMEQQHQLETFKTFRHDKGKLDKFRTMISSNADIIQGVAQHVAGAASAAFPPSSAVLTAFTFVMNASKHVSEDYDIIEGFFSIMDSFLRRLSLLESKIPPRKEFQYFIINVFSSLMKLSAMARSYCAKGRFLKWAKALVDGKDPDLTAAYDTLNENLSRLESATLMQTLRMTIENSEKMDTTIQGIKGLQGQMERNTAITIQTLETSEQTLMVSMQTNVGMQEVVLHTRDAANASNELLRRQEHIIKKLDKMQGDDTKQKQRNLKSGASRPVNFDRLKANLSNPAEAGNAERVADLEISYVDGLFEWVEDDPAFQRILDGDEHFLWVNGASGMGKSVLSFRMLRYLERRFAYDPSMCIAWFFFDEDHAEMRSIVNMMLCCSIQAAEKNERYCAETLTQFRSYLDFEEPDAAWTQFIESKFSKGSDRQLILLLDGVDEATDEGFTKLVDIFSKIKSKECRIQVILTSDSDKKTELGALEASSIDLTREKIVPDMRRFAWSRTKTLSRLRKVRTTLRKTIIKKVVRKADSFLYIDHTMRRLNTLSREGLILKELENLPENTTALYHTLLEECQKNRSLEEKELLRNLLAWLAYTKTKFTVGQANLLIDIIKKENFISIEEELEGRLSRLLRISGDRTGSYQDDSSDDNENDHMSDGDVEIQENAEDANNFLSFQERSLKAYFRQAIYDRPDGLRCTTVEAQVIVFRTCSAILTRPEKKQTSADWDLVRYASSWGLHHLLSIKVDAEGIIDDRLAKIVLESIFNIFTNKNDALKPLEERGEGSSGILDGNDVSRDEILAALSMWAKRALRLPPNTLSYGVLDWFRPLAQEPMRIFISLARAHITNWFSSTNIWDAYCSFRSAHFALQHGKHLPELKQNPVLTAYFKDYEEGQGFTERSFEIVASAFWDIVKTSSSFKGVGRAMKFVELYEAADRQLSRGLEDETIDELERFELLGSKGDALLRLGRRETNEEERRSHLEEALKTLEQANEIYRKVDALGQANEYAREAALFSFINTAHSAALLGKFDLVLQRTEEGFNTKIGPNTKDLVELIEDLRKAGQLALVLDVIKLIPKSDIVWFFFDGGQDAAQEAARRLDQGQYMLDLYGVVLRFVETFSPSSKIWLQMEEATFARQALGESELSKKLLHEIINNPKSQDWRVAEACNRLAEIFYEEFRLSKDPHVKKRALDETRKLLDKLAEVLPEHFNSAESHITATVALMLRRLGPSLELFDRLNGAFRNCLDNLRDDTGANDSDALRRLARVLSCLPGFDKEASISLTTQFYIIDEDIRRKEREEFRGSEADASASGEGDAANDAGAEGDVKVEHDGTQALNSIDAIVNGGDGDRIRPAEVAAKAPVGQNEAEEGLLEDWGFTCNICAKSVSNWSQGGAYLCIYCIDCDICEECYVKKMAREKGELEADWRVICPVGHRHVKAPIDGWAGVRDGKLRVGAEEVPFKAWLAQLETKWAGYWEGFWTEGAHTGPHGPL